MLSFQQQQKILASILQRDTNKHCADCGSHTPTWASLDFGVFVCSNCSGAHRGLGPTVTRIKSTKLDQWNRDWVENMRIGNIEINQYWEADSKTALHKYICQQRRKPRVGASLDEHNRFVVDKYMRRKFVTDKATPDPLSAYKSGKYVPQSVDRKEEAKHIIHNSSPEIDITNSVPLVKQLSATSNNKSENFSLLDDDSSVQSDNNNYGNHNTHNNNNHHHGNNNNNQKNSHLNNNFNNHNNHNDMHKKKQQQPFSAQHEKGSADSQKGSHNNQADDEFTDYVQVACPVETQSHDGVIANNYHFQQGNVPSHSTQQQQKDPSKISFDELLKSPPQLTSSQSQHQLYGQQQWGMYTPAQQQSYNGFAPQHNYAGYGNQQFPHSNQFAHNPYIGYAPRNNLHAAYSQPVGSNVFTNFTLH